MHDLPSHYFLKSNVKSYQFRGPNKPTPPRKCVSLYLHFTEGSAVKRQDPQCRHQSNFRLESGHLLVGAFPCPATHILGPFQIPQKFPLPTSCFLLPHHHSPLSDYIQRETALPSPACQPGLEEAPSHH